MKILFVLSQIEVTGAETYALTLAAALRERGHEIIFISEKLRESDGFKFYSLPLHSKNSSYLGRIQNIFSVKNIMQQEKFDLVHSHSRAANLVTFFALWGWGSASVRNRIPMAVTVHGRWRNHFAARALPCMGERTIVVCPYLKKYLSEDLKISTEQIEMVPNGIDTKIYAPAASEKNSGLQEAKHSRPLGQMLYVGRFSGQKGKALRFLLQSVLPELFKKIPGISLRIVGGARPNSGLKEMIENLNLSLKREIIKIIEPGMNLLNFYQSAGIVIGSGRVALEGMSCGKPVVAIGESSAPGLITPENFEQAFDSNFGDCGAWNLFEQQNNLSADLERVLTNKPLADSLAGWGRNLILERFDSGKIALQIERIYAKMLRERSFQTK